MRFYVLDKSGLINPKPRRDPGARGGVLIVRRTSEPTKERRIRVYEAAFKTLPRLGRLVERNAWLILLLIFGLMVEQGHANSMGLSATSGSEFRLDWLHSIGTHVSVGPVVSVQNQTVSGVTLAAQGIGLNIRHQFNQGTDGGRWTVDGRFLSRTAILSSQGREGHFDFAEIQGTGGYQQELFWTLHGRVAAGFQWRGLAAETWLTGVGGPLKTSLVGIAGVSALLEIGLLKASGCTELRDISGRFGQAGHR
jgi:hypothetical protein